MIRYPVRSRQLRSSAYSRLAPISADSLAAVHHSAEMIGSMFVHHLSGDPLSVVTNVKFPQTEGESVIRAVIDPEDLEPGTTFIGVGEDDGRHGQRPFLLKADNTPQYLYCGNPAEVRHYLSAFSLAFPLGNPNT
jgi:hypothetical protein